MGTSIHMTTEREIGNIKYTVVSAPSEKASETLDKKIEKLIKKDIAETIAEQHFHA